MVAEARECTQCNFRHGSALRLDARIVSRGALRVHLRGGRWIRSGAHRLNLQQHHHSFAKQRDASLRRAQDFQWTPINHVVFEALLKQRSPYAILKFLPCVLSF